MSPETVPIWGPDIPAALRGPVRPGSPFTLRGVGNRKSVCQNSSVAVSDVFPANSAPARRGWSPPTPRGRGWWVDLRGVEVMLYLPSPQIPSDLYLLPPPHFRTGFEHRYIDRYISNYSGFKPHLLSQEPQAASSFTTDNYLFCRG